MIIFFKKNCKLKRTEMKLIKGSGVDLKKFKFKK